MIRQFNDVGKLAQFETVNSLHYTRVKVDPNYINLLNGITKCQNQ